MRAESWWDQRWSASIMLKRTSFCYISIENGNDGGARKLKRVVGVIGKEFGRALDLRQRVKRPPVKVVEIIKPGNSVTARTWAIIACASNIKDVIIWHHWLWSPQQCRRSRAQTRYFLPSWFLKYIRYQSLCRYDRKEERSCSFLKDQLCVFVLFLFYHFCVVVVCVAVIPQMILF